MEDPTFWLAFVAGLLSFVSPCVLPLVPAYVGYMSGRATRNIAIEKQKNDAGVAVKPSRTGMLMHGLAFVLGFTVVFVLIGLAVNGAAAVLGSMAQQILGRIGGIIIIVFGLHFMGILRQCFAYFKKREQLLDSVFTTIVVVVLFAIFAVWGFVSPVLALPVIAGFVLWLVMRGAFITPKDFWIGLLNQLEILLYSDTRRDMDVKASDGLSGSFTMGVIFSAGWTPCIGPIYGAILGMSLSGEFLQAAPLLAAYSIGLGIPFLLTALALEGAQGLLRRLQKHMRTLELVTGAFLIFIGFMVASGQMQRLLTSTPEQTALASRVETCGIDFIQGHLTFGQASSCIGGSLVPLEFDVSTSVILDEDRTERNYLVDIDEAVTVDVLFMSVEESFGFSVEVRDEDGLAIATSDELTLLEEDDYIAVNDVDLPVGQYTFVLRTDGSEVNFRFKVVDSNEEELTFDEANSVSSIDTTELTGLNTIEGAVDENALTIGLDEGDIAPGFTITTLDGNDVSLSDLRGQVVLLNFWGTWCAPCRREMPDFQHVYEEYGTDGFAILAIAVRDSEDNMREFRDEFGLTFPLALDVDSTITNDYAITRQPSTLIIDPNGVIVYKNLGIVVEQQIVDVLSTTLP